MATKILGKVVITPKGEFNEATTYQKLDVVTYQGSSFICLQKTVSNLPTNTEYWQLIAEKGEQGEQGEQGIQGVQGEKGDKGDTGATGETGPAGQDGLSATIQVGTVNTLPAGSNATITNSGNETNAIFNFGIPKGEKGAKGDKGDTGEIPEGTIESDDVDSIEVVETLPDVEQTNVLYLVKESVYLDDTETANISESSSETEVTNE